MFALVEVGSYRKVIPSVDDISAVLSKAVRQPASSLPNVHCRWTFDAKQTINHVFRDAGKMSRDVNMSNKPFGCCNYGWRIGHFRVPKILTFKMRLGAQPFLWKWVLFAWEWKMISISKAEHLPFFWNRDPGELGNGLFKEAEIKCAHFSQLSKNVFSKSAQICQKLNTVSSTTANFW